MKESIYIRKIIDKNVGPLTNVRIDFPYNNDGTPKPVILVGGNGTGKSTILSNIVDAFIELAGRVYSNVNHPDERSGYQYYKAILQSEIHNGASYMYSYIDFDAQSNPKYIVKAGNVSVEKVKEEIGDNLPGISWKEDERTKAVSVDENTIQRIWSNNVICYFGPDRYEKPAWMGDKYYRTEDILHPTVQRRYDGILNNHIIVQNVISSNLQWLLDVIADSRADIEGSTGAMRLANYVNAQDIFLLKQARENLETILSQIIGEDVFFQLNYRNSGDSRFRIVSKATGKTICPTLDSLSTGQIALFNLFATIVRYADNNDINKSFHLNDITGIVVIDEIDLHLHAKLQKEVLPPILKLFPKIQFVITTHAPLFLLGMKETFGEGYFEIIELPKAIPISTEKFAEFQRAYAYLKKTETYQEEAKKIEESIHPQGKAIIITEGSTDWKHLKAAYNQLSKDEQYASLFEGIDFQFLEYESTPGKAKYVLNMGNGVLAILCENLAKLPQPVEYIFIADRDDDKINKKMSVHDEQYKNWGNNVYSFVLPVPAHRQATPMISIEHYYTDDEIKTEWEDPDSGNRYRLYMGNEFDERGLAPNIDRFCEKTSKCGNSSIAIIEGSSGEKVTSINNDKGINYALSKSKFAQMILDRKAPFDNFNFDSFIPVFELIKSIIMKKGK